MAALTVYGTDPEVGWVPVLEIDADGQVVFSVGPLDRARGLDSEGLKTLVRRLRDSNYYRVEAGLRES